MPKRLAESSTPRWRVAARDSSVLSVGWGGNRLLDGLGEVEAGRLAGSQLGRLIFRYGLAVADKLDAHGEVVMSIAL